MRSFLKYLFILIAVFTSTALFCQPKINFEQTDFQQVIEKSKADNMPVFIMVYADWCTHCTKMKEEVLTDTSVINFFNKTFISLMVNGETSEGLSLRQIYSIRSYPAFLFIDKNKVLLHKVCGELKTADFISEAQNALKPEMQLPFLEKQYYKDVTNTENCLKYVNALKKGNDLDKLSEVSNIYFATQKESQLITTSNWKIIAIAVNDLNSREFQYVLKHQNEFAAVSSQSWVENKILSIVSQMLQPAMGDVDSATYNTNRLLVKSIHLTRADSLLFSYDLQFYEQIKDWKKYNEVTKASVKEFAWNDYQTINEICKNYLNNISDKENIKLAITWAKRSIELKESHENDFIVARLYSKTDDKKQANEYALKAKRIKEEMGWDTNDIDNFLLELKK